MGLLHSRSRIQQKFKMSANVCPDDIFWTTEYFVTKPGMVMQHHKPECRVEKFVHCVQCQGHSKGLYNQNMTVSVVSSILLVTAKVQNVSECLSRWCFLCVSDHVRSVSPELLNHFFFTELGMVVYYNEAMCHADKLVYYLKCQGHSEGLYNQNQTLYTVSSELVHLQPNLIW